MTNFELIQDATAIEYGGDYASLDTTGWSKREDLTDDTTGWTKREYLVDDTTGWSKREDESDDTTGWTKREDASEDTTGWSKREDSPDATMVKYAIDTSPDWANRKGARRSRLMKRPTAVEYGIDTEKGDTSTWG